MRANVRHHSEAGTESPALLSQLPVTPRLRSFATFGAGILVIALLLFFLHGRYVLRMPLAQPYIVTTAIQLLAAAATFILALLGRLTLAVKFSLIVLTVTISAEPYVVTPDTLSYTLVLLPIAYAVLVIVSGLVCRLPVSLGLALFGATNTALAYRNALARPELSDFPAGELLPLMTAGVLVAGVVAYLWVKVTTMLLDRAEGLVAQRDLLMQEVNHRVKNSLQLVTSVLELQSRETEAPEATLALESAKNRISAVAAVHEALHEAGNQEAVSIRSFLSLLVETFTRSVDDPRASFFLDPTVPDTPIDPRVMVPLGIVVNELLTNSVQHGMTEGKLLETTVSLDPTPEGAFVLVIADNGRGMPADNSGEEGLGLTLVRNLTEDQLGGTLCVESNGGVTTRITIPNRYFRRTQGDSPPAP